jgi:hypothetical protein
MLLLRLCVSSSVRASQTHHGESDRHGATGRKEDLHGHEYACFNPRADALSEQPSSESSAERPTGRDCCRINEEIRRRQGLGIGSNAIFSHAARFIPMSGFNREAKNLAALCSRLRALWSFLASGHATSSVESAKRFKPTSRMAESGTLCRGVYLG